MIASIILGEIIYCEICDNVKAQQYQSETSAAVLESMRNMIGYNEKYSIHTGICQECIKKYHFKVLSVQEHKLIERYLKQLKNYKSITAFLEKAVDHFSENLSPWFLESINPEAVTRYRANTDYDELQMKYLPARRYLAEIKSDIIAWLAKDAGKQIAASQRKISEKKHLIADEEKVKNFLSETKGVVAYYHPNILSLNNPYRNPFFRLLKRKRKKKPWLDEIFRELCEGKNLTDIEFFIPIRYTRDELQTIVDDATKYEIPIGEYEFEQLYKFNYMLDTLPMRIVENHFWK